MGLPQDNTFVWRVTLFITLQLSWQINSFLLSCMRGRVISVIYNTTCQSLKHRVNEPVQAAWFNHISVCHTHNGVMVSAGLGFLHDSSCRNDVVMELCWSSVDTPKGSRAVDAWTHVQHDPELCFTSLQSNRHWVWSLMQDTDHTAL